MAKNNNLQDLLRSVSDVLRAAEGSTALINPQDYDNKIAECIVDAPSVHSWADTRTTADGGTIKDGIAYVKALRGKSIKVNQLVADPTFADASKWKNYYNNADLVIENNVLKATFTGTGTVFPQSKIATPKVYASHKYFMFVDFKKSVSESTRISFSYLGGGFDGCAVTKTFGTSWERVAFVGNARSDTNNGYMSIALSGMTQGTELYLRNFCVIDLTACGIDTLTTADAVAQYFGYASVNDMLPLPYQADTIVLNCKQKSVISKTKYKTINLGSLDWNASTNRFNQTTAGKLTDAVDGVNIICSRYTASTKAASRGQDKTICIANGGFIYVYDTAYSDAASFKAAMSGVMLTYESTEYTTLDTLTLPTLTAFPNGLCGVGTAYDEVDLAEGKATKRIGCVDLGTLNYTEAHGAQRFYTTGLASTIKKGDSGIVPNLICSIYYGASHYGQTNGAWVSSAGYLSLNDTGYEGLTAAQFKTAMSGVLLFYELATAEESTFDPCRAYYKASNNGQEVATADTATAPFTAEIGYKEPTATELANALNG